MTTRSLQATLLAGCFQFAISLTMDRCVTARQLIGRRDVADGAMQPHAIVQGSVRLRNRRVIDENCRGFEKTGACVAVRLY